MTVSVLNLTTGELFWIGTAAILICTIHGSSDMDEHIFLWRLRNLLQRNSLQKLRDFSYEKRTMRRTQLILGKREAAELWQMRTVQKMK